MANTLTGLIPDLHMGLRTISRELTGYTSAVAINANGMQRAAVGENVTYPKVPKANGVDISPAMTIPEPTDQTVAPASLSITKSRAYEFGIVGEEVRGLDNGPGFATVQSDMFAEAVRGITNEIETDIAVAVAAGASRAIGTPGTTPFATDSAGVSDVRKILVDNGSPTADLNLVNDTTAGAKLRTLYGINTDRDWSKVPIRERGVLTNPHGVAIRESAQVQSHTKGTASSATTDNAGYAVGATTITLASAGTGTILAGDVVTFAGDVNKYVVKTGDADVSGGGTIVLHAPGLRVAMSAATKAITVENSYTANTAFHRNAVQLVMRAPALPKEGDNALQRTQMTDPMSGLTFEVAVYPGYRKVRYEVAASWGVGVTQEEHVALLFG